MSPRDWEMRKLESRDPNPNRAAEGPDAPPREPSEISVSEPLKIPLPALATGSLPPSQPLCFLRSFVLISALQSRLSPGCPSSKIFLTRGSMTHSTLFSLTTMFLGPASVHATSQSPSRLSDASLQVSSLAPRVTWSFFRLATHNYSHFIDEPAEAHKRAGDQMSVYNQSPGLLLPAPGRCWPTPHTDHLPHISPATGWETLCLWF